MAGSIHAVDAPKAGTAVQYVTGNGQWRKATVKRAHHKENRYVLTNHVGVDVVAYIKNNILHSKKLAA